MALNENKLLELNATVDKSKDIENLNGIIIEKIKVSRDSTFTIVNNPNISKDQKILSLQEQNMSLIDTMYELQEEIKKISDEISYSEYRLFDASLRLDFQLVEEKIIFKTWTVPIKDLLSSSRRDSGIDLSSVYKNIRFYKINYKDIKKFIEIVNKLGIQII